MAKRRKTRRSPLLVAKQIASRLAQLGIHGRFDVQVVDLSNAIRLQSTGHLWVEFKVAFNPNSTQEIESIGIIAEQFLAPLWAAGYRGHSMVLVRTVLGREGDQGWRTLTETLDIRASLGQVGSAARRWMHKPEYLAATGIAVRIEYKG